MRKIKFRGRWEHPHDEYNTEWKYTSLTSQGLIFDSIVNPKTIGQFTGLYDNDGKEIYEGDIIHVLGSNNEPCRHIVKYSDETGGYCQFLFQAQGIFVEPFDAGILWQQYITEQCKEVIGNLHDNPELLTKN